MNTLELTIDAGAARQGAREFARSAAEIVESARAAKLAVDGVEESFNRLLEAQYSTKNNAIAPGSSGVVPVVFSPGAVEANNLDRNNDLLVLAESSQSETSRAVVELLLRPRNRFQSFVDSFAESIETLGLSGSLGKDFEIPGLNALGAVVRFINPIVEAFKGEKTLQETFGLINEFNKPIPGLRNLASQQSGQGKLAIESLIQGFEASSDELLDRFLDEVDKARSRLFTKLQGENLVDSKALSAGPNFSQLLRIMRTTRNNILEGEKQEIENIVDMINAVFRNEVDPDDRARIRERIEQLGLPPVQNSEAQARSVIPISGSTNLGGQSNLLINASLGMPIVEQFRTPTEEATAANQTITQTLQDSLPLFDEFSSSARRAFEDYANSATNVGGQVGDVIGKSLQGAEDALAQFVQTGKLDFKSLADSIIADLIRIAIRSAVLGPIAQLLGGAFGGGSSFLDIAATRTSQPGGMGGFAQGGAFTVGGSGGTDSQMVRFRATPGERVSVTRPDRRDQAGGVNLTVNVNNEVPEARVSAQATEGDNGTALRIQVARVIAEDVRAGGEVFRSFRDTFGANPLRREVS